MQHVSIALNFTVTIYVGTEMRFSEKGSAGVLARARLSQGRQRELLWVHDTYQVRCCSDVEVKTVSNEQWERRPCQHHQYLGRARQRQQAPRLGPTALPSSVPASYTGPSGLTISTIAELSVLLFIWVQRQSPLQKQQTLGKGAGGQARAGPAARAAPAGPPAIAPAIACHTRQPA